MYFNTLFVYLIKKNFRYRTALTRDLEFLWNTRLSLSLSCGVWGNVWFPWRQCSQKEGEIQRHGCDLVSITMGPGESLVLSVPVSSVKWGPVGLSQGLKAKVCVKYFMSPACSAYKLQVHYSAVPALVHRSPARIGSGWAQVIPRSLHPLHQGQVCWSSDASFLSPLFPCSSSLFMNGERKHLMAAAAEY